MANPIDVDVLGWRLHIGRTCVRLCPPIDQPPAATYQLPTTTQTLSAAAIFWVEVLQARRRMDSISPKLT
jgi:hypothetical protein